MHNEKLAQPKLPVILPAEAEKLGLTEEEQEALETIFVSTAEYGAMPPERAQLTPGLRQGLVTFWRHGLFSLNQYTEGENLGYSEAIHQEDKVHWPTDPVIKDPRGDLVAGQGGGEDRHWGWYDKAEYGVVEALSVLPLMPTEIKETVTPRLLGLRKERTTELVRRPLLFQEYIQTPSKFGKEHTVRVTYQASSKRVPGVTQYESTVWLLLSPKERPVSQLATLNDGGGGISSSFDVRAPQLSSPPAENIAFRQEEIMKLKAAVDQKRQDSGRSVGRLGNILTISLTLPQSTAAKLMQSLEAHPEMIRPFFLAGGMNLMGYHLPPPYEEWDREKPEQPVLVRTFDEDFKKTDVIALANPTRVSK